MNVWKGLPWMALVLGSAPLVAAQATVGDEPPAAQNPIAAAAREGRSINITNDRLRGGTSGGIVPEVHVVERGDTLWDITGYYFNNPWRWPSVWGLNPHITNPHWIFPGDQVRLLSVVRGTRPVAPAPASAPSLIAPLRPRMAPGSVFIRDEGWLDERDRESAGVIVGSPEDQMLLSEGDQAYAEFRGNREPRVGETFTIYQDGQPARGGDRNAGHVVRIVGTAVVESWDRNRRTATVRITESSDSIERGERLGTVPRRLSIVPPVRNTTELRAHIVATIQPRVLVGQNMVALVDRGAEDGVRVGNRFFVLRRGDAWRRSLTVGEQRVNSTGIDRDGDGVADPTPPPAPRDNSLPEEVVGELLVVEVRPRSCAVLVTTSNLELEIGEVLVMRRGY